MRRKTVSLQRSNNGSYGGTRQARLDVAGLLNSFLRLDPASNIETKHHWNTT